MGILASWGRWICARVAGDALEVDSGAGEAESLLEREGHDVVAVEARRAAALPFDDASFDTVVLGDFLAQWVGRERPLAEARRVLRPGGRLIVAVPYAGAPGEDDEAGVSMQDLLAELGEFSLKEIATVGGRLCLLAERSREKSRAGAWRRALGVAEGRLAEREEKVAALAASVDELRAGREREERALADARGDVERLERALAAATHQRDLKGEAARLAGDGVAVLEERIERLRREAERAQGAAERAQADGERKLSAAEREAERALAEAESAAERRLAEAAVAAERERAEAERRAAQALADAESRREAELAAAAQELSAARALLAAREEELERSRGAAQAAQRELSAVQESLRERERANAVLERDLAARVRELGLAGEQLVARERELDLANGRLSAREAELDAASTLLEAQGGELAQAREALRIASREHEGALRSVAREHEEVLRIASREHEEALRRTTREHEEALRSAAQERDEILVRLEARERHLQNAKAGIVSRDGRLEAAGRVAEAADARLEAQEAEIAGARQEIRRSERKLALAEARLEKAQQRAEAFRGSLVTLRQGRSYRLMRILWRLRHPFRRTSSAVTAEPAAAEEDPDPSDVPGVKYHYGHQITGTSPAVAPAPPPRRPGERLRVAAILDEMSAACFAPECDLVALGFDGWREQLDEQRPDLLLVESAWSGNGGEWQYRIARYPRPDLAGLPALRELVDGCRERGIPTAFWNKEDPVHFDRFSEAASLFDHVFTTDARCVERYRALPGERTVTPLPFAAQPRIHNPVAAVAERSASPCFAGAWYRDRHPERRQALEALLDAARPYGLVIYDRSFGGSDAAFGFPERFRPHILGKLPYEDILDVYKSHRVFLNANSVAESPTMCSRRVFELAACDTAILSTPAVALKGLLGGETVAEASGEGEARESLELLLGDPAARRRRTRAARRAVLAGHTYAERLATIAETAGLDASSLRREPFAVPHAPGANGRSPLGGSDPGGDGAADSHPWVLSLQPDVTLAEPALADLAAATTYSEADVIGAHPASNGDAALEHRYVPDVDPAAVLIRRDLLETRGWPTAPAEQRIRLREWSDDGIRIYAADADLVRPAWVSIDS